VGNSGTTIRILAGILAGSHVESTLTGDDSILRRPMLRVVQPLRAMGADIQGEEGGRLPPLRISGTPLDGRDHDLEMASAQVKSALLFAGLRASGTTSVAEPARSRDHTERLFRYLGLPIDESNNRLIIKAAEIPPSQLAVPGDLSSAAFFLVAAAIQPDSHVRIDDVGLNPTRSGILDILSAFGAKVVIENLHERCGEPWGSVEVRAADRRPLEVSGSLTVRSIDELPLVAVLGAHAEGETVVRDAGELRVKESDRIEAMVLGLQAMGVDAAATPDGFVVRGRGGRFSGARIDPRGDHRIAMAFAVAGITASEGQTVVDDWGCVAVSYPGFEGDLARVAVR